MEQPTFATAGGFERFRKVTRKAVLLRTLDRVIPWERLERIVAPYYPKNAGPGRPATPLRWMLKLMVLQVIYNLSDPQTEDQMHDCRAVQEFLGLDLGRDRPPDETTICRFRHLLEKHDLMERIFRAINRYLHEAGVRVQQGTIVDATVIRAPQPRRRKRSREGRNEEFGVTQRGGNWQYGMKLHVGVDSRTKVIHSVAVTPANVHDSQVLLELLHGRERRVYGDRAYVGQGERIRRKAPRARQFIERRRPPRGQLTAAEARRNRWKARIRATVEHLFRVMKYIFAWRQVRFATLEKNRHYAYLVAALANVYYHRKRLLRYCSRVSHAQAIA